MDDDNMCVHEQYRCSICDHAAEIREERRLKEARKRKPKPPTTGLPMRVDQFERRLGEYASGLRCMSCDELKHEGYLCSCRRAADIKRAIYETTSFAGVGTVSIGRAAAATLAQSTFQLGTATRRVSGDHMEADEIRTLVSAMR